MEETAFGISIVGIILAVVAIIMTFSSFTQITWGRPKIRLMPEVREDSNLRSLIYSIYNVPINSSFLRSIGVWRESIPLFGHFSIESARTHEMLATDININNPSIELPMLDPTRDLVVAFRIIHSNVNRSLITQLGEEIPPGKYLINIMVNMGGRQFKLKRQFIVGETMEELCWESDDGTTTFGV